MGLKRVFVAWNGVAPPQSLNPVLAIKDENGIVYVGAGPHIMLAGAVRVENYESGYVIDGE